MSERKNVRQCVELRGRRKSPARAIKIARNGETERERERVLESVAQEFDKAVSSGQDVE